MKNVKYVFAIGFLLVIISCSVNRSRSNVQQYKTYTVSDVMYGLNLERLSDISEDSLILNDEIEAVAFLNDFESADKFDFEKRSVTHRNIKEVLDVGRFKNQSGTKLVFQFWVDRKGDLVAVRFDDSSTAEIDEYSKPKILKAVMGYKVDPDENSFLLMSGELSIVLNTINSFYN